MKVKFWAVDHEGVIRMRSPKKEWLPKRLVYTIWLVVLTILKNMSSSMGRMIPYIMDNSKNV